MSGRPSEEDSQRERKFEQNLHWLRPTQGAQWEVSQRQFALLDATGSLLRFIQQRADGDGGVVQQHQFHDDTQAVVISLRAWQARNPAVFRPFNNDINFAAVLLQTFNDLQNLALKQPWTAASDGDAARVLVDPTTGAPMAGLVTPQSTRAEALVQGLSVAYLPEGTFSLRASAQRSGAYTLFVKHNGNVSPSGYMLIPVNKSTAWQGPESLDPPGSMRMRTYQSLYALGDALKLRWQNDRPKLLDNLRRSRVNQTIAAVLDNAKQPTMLDLAQFTDSAQERETALAAQATATRLRDVIHNIFLNADAVPQRVLALIGWAINLALLDVLLGDYNYHPVTQLSSTILEQSVAICDEFRAPAAPVSRAPQ